MENVLERGDIVYINGVRFRSVYSFSVHAGDKNLLLKWEEEPETYYAETEDILNGNI